MTSWESRSPVFLTACAADPPFYEPFQIGGVDTMPEYANCQPSEDLRSFLIRILPEVGGRHTPAQHDLTLTDQLLSQPPAPGSFLN